MKCSICGKHGFSNESYADICHCERKDYIKEIERLKKELNSKFFTTDPPDSYCDECLNAEGRYNKCAECKYSHPSKFQSIDSHTMVDEGHYP